MRGFAALVLLVSTAPALRAEEPSGSLVLFDEPAPHEAAQALQEAITKRSCANERSLSLFAPTLALLRSIRPPNSFTSAISIRVSSESTVSSVRFNTVAVSGFDDVIPVLLMCWKMGDSFICNLM